jgi:DNA-binding beta-propeller fold protein YncE
LANDMLWMGEGRYRYAVDVDWWGTLPDGVELGYTHGVAVDSRDHVYVFHTGNPSILEFDPDGGFLRAFAEEFAGGAHGFYLHPEAEGEFLYVTDIAHARMTKLTLDGEALLELETPDRPDIYDQDRRFVPTDVTVAPNGDIYIADGYGQNWIHQYDAAGRYIRSWGGTGSEAGQLNCPHGISVDVRRGEPELYVADRGNHRIQVFTLDGRSKRMITDDLDMPCNFYFREENLYIADLHSRVTIFDGQDQLVTHLGADPQAYHQAGWPNLPKTYYRPDKFNAPHRVCADSRGNLYVAEWIADGRLTRLTWAGAR